MGLRKLTPEKHRGKGMTTQKIFGEFKYEPVDRAAEATGRRSLADTGEVPPAFPSLCHHEDENSRPVGPLRPQLQRLKPKVVPLQIWLEIHPSLKPRGTFHLVLQQNLSLPSSTVFLRFIFNECGLCEWVFRNIIK